MEKEVTNGELLEAIIGGFSKIENRFNKVENTMSNVATRMATKDELSALRLDLKTDIAQVSTDLQSFKSETHARFDTLEEHLKENEESVGAIVADYHPRIIALEEKVFGHSTLAEN